MEGIYVEASIKMKQKPNKLLMYKWLMYSITHINCRLCGQHVEKRVWIIQIYMIIQIYIINKERDKRVRVKQYHHVKTGMSVRLTVVLYSLTFGTKQYFHMKDPFKIHSFVFPS